MSIYSLTTSFLARSEHPVLSAGVLGVPLQAGLALGNSLHNFPVSTAYITQNRCIGSQFHPHVGHSNYAGVSAVSAGSQTQEIELISRIRYIYIYKFVPSSPTRL